MQRIKKRGREEWKGDKNGNVFIKRRKDEGKHNTKRN